MRFIILMFFALSVSCFGQNSDNKATIKIRKNTDSKKDTILQSGSVSYEEIIIPTSSQDNNDTTIYTIVEEMPQFPGGDAEMMKFIMKNFRYPSITLDGNYLGTIYATFVVNKDGKITDCSVLRPTNFSKFYDEEAIRVIKLMPDWKSGKNNGKSVRVRFNLPIRIHLQ